MGSFLLLILFSQALFSRILTTIYEGLSISLKLLLLCKFEFPFLLTKMLFVILQSYKHSVDQYENDLLSVVHSLLLSMNETGLHFVKSTPCNASCIRFSLVKLLRLSGYDAAVCASRWQGCGKVPGGKLLNL